MSKSNGKSTVEEFTELIKTPVAGNVMPLLVCFLVTSGCLCGILYIQMTKTQDDVKSLTNKLSTISLDLQKLDTTLGSIKDELRK